MSVGSGNIGPNYIAPIPTGYRDWDFANPESRDWKITSGIAIQRWVTLRRNFGLKGCVLRQCLLSI